MDIFNLDVEEFWSMLDSMDLETLWETFQQVHNT